MLKLHAEVFIQSVSMIIPNLNYSEFREILKSFSSFLKVHMLFSPELYPGVLQGLLGCESVIWVHLQERVNEFFNHLRSNIPNFAYKLH